jgi:hypothetical protein
MKPCPKCKNYCYQDYKLCNWYTNFNLNDLRENLLAVFSASYDWHSFDDLKKINDIYYK